MLIFNLKDKIIIIGIILLIFPLVILFNNIEYSSYRYLLLIVFTPIFLFLSLNFKIISSLFIVSLFLDFGFYYFSVSEIVSILLLISFLLTYKFKVTEIKNSQSLFFGVFVLSILPSYTLLLNNIEALSLGLHLVLFIIVIEVFSIAIKSYKQLKYYFIIFSIIALFNSFDVIVSAFYSGKRAFGFAGIMFVDYVGYALVISFVTFIYKKKYRIKAFIFFSIFSFALVYTQTRSIWIVISVTILFIVFHVLVNRKLYEISLKNSMLVFSSLILILSILFISFKQFNSNIGERLEIRKIEQTDDPNRLMIQINSFVTRYFIWTTAWNAFESSPIIGIGFYGFPFLSQNYSDLDPFIYESFVKKLTPHETFLAVLTEGGIVGLFGFLLFLIYSLIYSWKSIKVSFTPEQKFYSLLIFWLTIYTYLSMIITDAWLWGHGLMLWSILIAFSIGNRKILSIKQNDNLILS